MFIIYDIIILLFIVLYVPCLICKGKYHAGIWRRFRCELISAEQTIWIHAVSVGEVLAVVGLLKRLKEEVPQYKFILSIVTKTGHEVALSQLKGCTIIYAPIDLSWVVRSFIKIISPKVYIAAETEIWPNLYEALHKAEVPIIQINGRISDKSFQGYQRAQFLTKNILKKVSYFCMQSSLDAQRIISLGALENKVEVVGNLKFDGLVLGNKKIKKDLGFDESHELLIAASTHPGEEVMIAEIYKQLIKQFDSLRLVIVPRHIERAEKVVREMKEQGLDQDKVVVIDKIGILNDLYPLAKLVFVGKSFKVGGGQNMIEPVACGKPTFVGPHTQNFKDVMKTFLEENIIFQVADEEELLKSMEYVLNHPENIQSLAAKSKDVIVKYQGATDKTVKRIMEWL